MADGYEALELLFGQGESEEVGDLVPLPSMPLLAAPPAPDERSVAAAVDAGEIQQRATNESPQRPSDLDDIRIGDEIELPDGSIGVVSWIDPRRKRLAVGKGRNRMFLSVTETEKVSGRKVAADLDKKRRQADREEGREHVPEPSQMPAVIEVPPGLTLMPHQIETVEFLTRYNGRGLVAAEMGLGKTVTTIVAMKPPVVVVCPASVKVNWCREINRWRPDMTVVMLDGTTAPTVSRGLRGRMEEVDARMVHDADVVVLNYDILYAHVTPLLGRDNRTVVADEAHYLKNLDVRWDGTERRHRVKGGPRRARAFYELQRDSPGLILLTGTPILNRPKELFPHLHMLDPRTWGSGYKFCVRYCAGKYEFLETKDGRKTSKEVFKCDGRSNSEELHERINNVYMIRHTKEAELPNLPPKQRGTKVVSLSPKYAQMYRAARNDFLTWLASKGDDPEAVARAMRAPVLTKLNALRAISAEGKAEAVLHEIVNFFQSTQRPLIVMGSHRKAFARLAAGMDKVNETHRKQMAKGDPDLPREIRYASLLGGTSVKQRQATVDEFQAGNIDVLFYSIAIAEGTTLTRATDMLFFERMWVPSQQLQAEDRAHRIGSSEEHRLQITYLDGEGTIDVIVGELLQDKTKSAAAIIDGKELTEDEASQIVLGDMLGPDQDWVRLLTGIMTPNLARAPVSFGDDTPLIYDEDGERFDAYDYGERLERNAGPDLYERLVDEGVLYSSWGDPL